MNNNHFVIDPGFDELCFTLGKFNTSYVLLMNNAEIPWFILIPETQEVELCDLAFEVHDSIFNEIRCMSFFVKREFKVDKLNVASNGNVIRQMHLHVIGRRFDDYCWPGVVWGTDAPSTYDQSAVDEISDLLASDASLKDLGYRRV
ncbi:MAG: HIT domain-containing protein [Pseudomonadota bacterium]